MSMLNDIEWTKRGNTEKCISNSEKSQELCVEILARTLDIPRPWRRKEMVWNSQLYTWRKMGFHRTTDGGTIQRNWSSSSQEYQCFESWNSEKEAWQRYRTIQCGFIEHRTLALYKSLSKSPQSTEQSQAGVKSSVWGRLREPTSERFVAKENEKLLKNVKPQEVNSLVQTPRGDNRTSANRLRECLQHTETLEKDFHFTKVCEDASFWKRVSIEMCYKTIADADDGFGDRTLEERVVIYDLHLKDPGHDLNCYWTDLLRKNEPGSAKWNSCDAVRNSDESSVHLFRRS